jgi:hypothetical protein
MPSPLPDPPNDFTLRQHALARWENEGGTTIPIDGSRAGGAEQTHIPEMTNAEMVALRVRVIALENVLIPFSLPPLTINSSSSGKWPITFPRGQVSPLIRSRSMRRSIWLISSTAQCASVLRAKAAEPRDSDVLRY